MVFAVPSRKSRKRVKWQARNAQRALRAPAASTHFPVTARVAVVFNTRVVLLMNRSADAGSSICFELKATLTSRDAIGAIVSMTVRSEDGGSRVVRQQLTAGDGYMCTNERCLVIGTGRCTEVTDVTIEWPSGKVESLGNLATQRKYLVIEGTAEAFVIPGPG